jgi:hypothetical protein
MQDYNLVDLVKKVYQHINQPLAKDNGSYLCAMMIEENKLKIREGLFDLRVATNQLTDQLNNKSLNLSFRFESAAKVAAYVESINRTQEFVFSRLKDVLQPYWGAYWKEGCNTLDSIVYWVTMAEQDGGEKLKRFMEESRK